MAVEAAGNVYVAGTTSVEGFPTTVDAAGVAYLTGVTDSPDYPTTAAALDATLNGPQDRVVSVLNSTGVALVESTYFGGSGRDGGSRLAIDQQDNVFLTCWTDSADLQTTPGAFDGICNGGDADVFAAKLSPPDRQATRCPRIRPRARGRSARCVPARGGRRSTSGSRRPRPE